MLLGFVVCRYYVYYVCLWYYFCCVPIICGVLVLYCAWFSLALVGVLVGGQVVCLPGLQHLLILFEVINVDKPLT
jgi:hypothetical protein